MASAQVRTVEIDLSQRVQSYLGMYGLLIGAFEKGPVGKRTFIDSSQKMDKVCGKPTIGSDIAYFIAHTFLSKSKRLWLIRIADGAVYGGMRVGASYNVPVGFGDGVSKSFSGVLPFARCHPGTVDIYLDKTKVGYDDTRGKLVGNKIISSMSTVNYATGEVVITFSLPIPSNSVLYARWGLTNQPLSKGMVDPESYMFDDRVVTQEIIALDAVTYHDTLVPDNLVPPTDTVLDYTKSSVVIYDGVNVVAFADHSGIIQNNGPIQHLDTTYQNVIEYASGIVDFKLDASYTPASPLVATFVSYKADALLIVGDNPGAWTDKYSVLIDLINPANNSFEITVFEKDQRGVQNRVDGPYTLSRDHGIDGMNRQMYVEDRVNNNSYYIRIIDNFALSPTECIIQDSLEHTNITARVLTQLAGGTAGTTPSVASYINALRLFNNKDDIKIDIIMDTLGDRNYQLEIAKLCDRDMGGRGDCYGILYTPFYLEESNNYIEDLLTYRKYALNIYSSFVGLYTGHVQIYDGYTGRNIWIPNSGFVGAAFAYTADQFEPWFAAAGWRRGVLPVLDVYRRFTLPERDALADNDINPMRFRAGKGIAIWGQKTMLNIGSALDRANVRWLLIVIEAAIEEYLDNYEFEINDDLTRTLVRTTVFSYLDGVRLRRGLYAFEVICDKSNNTAEQIDALEMNLDFYVQPTRTAEQITSRAIITQTGVNFSSVKINF